MNCSQRLISLIFGTTNAVAKTIIPCCELLSKVDIFDIRNNNECSARLCVVVVNCSQRLISLIFGTTTRTSFIVCVLLWIALKGWYLWYSEQHKPSHLQLRCSCELLSKVDIFDIRNNNSIRKLFPVMLWIALKGWYLWYSEQPPLRNPSNRFGCELLSKVDIFDIRNNGDTVVYDTEELWIALKGWYLWYSEQPFVLQPEIINSCELLSKVDIFDIRNNFCKYMPIAGIVVNCSQRLISLIFGTTSLISLHISYSCELLSKVDIFDIRNNTTQIYVLFNTVVNCSQRLISLIFGTTH